MLEDVNKDFLEEEKNIIENIYKCIDDKKPLIFSAGAGAGKTYALVESLKYTCIKKEKDLRYNNQKIVCITYTNIATAEVKKRLGNTDLVLISTIHERLWDLISSYQNELIKIHSEFIKDQMLNLQNEIDDLSIKLSITKEENDKLLLQLIENQNKFYSISDFSANDFKIEFYKTFPYFDKRVKNANDFKKLCFKLIKNYKYDKCIKAIEHKEDGYQEVKYISKNNKDSLHRMKISHDTLLEYAYRIIKEYDELKRFIIDRYPYFFVDEYQDTNEKVIEILSLLNEYSKKIKHNIFVGYFGDVIQSIYDKGVGKNIYNYCEYFERIKKEYNRRSCDEIIALSNIIRNDEIEQKSIYKDSKGGTVEIYYGNENDIESFIKKNSRNIKELNNSNEITHCFLLLNKDVATQSGIEEIYYWFKDTPYYKKNYDAISTELLSNDINKLGEVERYIYNLIEFYIISNSNETSLLNIFNKSLYSNLGIRDIRNVVNCLQKHDFVYLKDILDFLQESKNNLFNTLKTKKDQKAISDSIDSIVGFTDISAENLRTILKHILFFDNDKEETIDSINNLLNMEIDIFVRWYNFINLNFDDETAFHTFHGTKGLEYDNVIMIFDDSFGKDKKYFANYFNYISGETKESDELKFEIARNLLYTAVTRARKNLRILYTGNYELYKNGFNLVFGTPIKWEDND